MKKKLNISALLFIILLPIVIAIIFTLVYYTSEVVVVNKFGASTYNVEISDNKTSEWGDREVSITNMEETNTPVVLRVNYNESWTMDDDKYLLVLSNNVDGNSVVDKGWTDEFIDNFYKADDGWYYYKKVLNAKESVKLLDSVYLNEDLIKNSNDYDKYLSYTYNLSFNYEAIQATDEAVLEIWDKNVDIKNNEVDWNF